MKILLLQPAIVRNYESIFKLKTHDTLKNFFNRKVYYLPQDHLLISNTIEKNICLSDGLIDKKKIDDAINKSDLADFVKN